MPSPFIGVRIPQDLHDTLQKHIAESGEKLPQIVQKALSQYLNYTQPIEAQPELEQRVEILETSLKILTEAIAQIQKESAQKLEKESEKELVSTGQLSFLESESDNRSDNGFDNRLINREPEEIPEEIPEETQETINSSDNQSDIKPDNKTSIQLETITSEEMAVRSERTIGTIQNYMSRGKVVKHKGFLYSPMKGKKKGESMWTVERIE